jgi:hypothetical protein
MDIELPPGVLAICSKQKINSNTCRIILNVMREVSQIDGSYYYDNRGNMTLLYIDPIDDSYVQSDAKYFSAMELFAESMQRVTERQGETSWE